MKFLAVASLALATVAGFVAAQSGVPDGTSCNGHYFSSDDISTAINAAIDDSNSGNYPDNYPHAYEHRASEDISLVCGSGPWSEFPLENGYAYTSSDDNYVSPGAYRVIYRNADGSYCASVYHENGSSDFAQCDDE